ncbi:MAG: multicopper oxidase domain-containing protein, partial [Gemmatimonadaceae bacterium]
MISTWSATGLALALGIAVAPSLSLAQHRAAATTRDASGHMRRYYIAADEVNWTYVPTGVDLAVSGKKFDLSGLETRGLKDPNATTYRKALYREYTDSSFRTLKPRAEAWTHLGILGPLIRAEVGDTIRILFRNNASRPYSVHPHGVFYRKNAEGMGYQDGTSAGDKKDDAVLPGSSYLYEWTVPERAGPARSDGSSAFWVYHSHVDEGPDINSGLIGPMIITRRGMARPDGSPKDVDREFVAQFGLYDEPRSWYWPKNLQALYGDPSQYHGENEAMHQFHHYYTING